MIRLIAAAVLALFSGLSVAESIERVIERTDKKIIESKRAISLDVVPLTVNSFERVRAATNAPSTVVIKVVEMDGTATTMGHTILVSIAIDQMTQVEREFVFAHEIGHIVLGHQQLLKDLWKKYVPGDATPQAIAAANILMQRELKQIAHAGEFAADEYALRTLLKLGYTRDQVVDTFLGFQRLPETITHPSTIRRAMRLRDLPL